MSDHGSPFFEASADDLEWVEGQLVRLGEAARGMSYQELVARTGAPVEAEGSAQRDPKVAEKYSMHSFGAVFAEVAIDPDVGTIRVRRLVGDYGIGRQIPRPGVARNTSPLYR